MFAESLIAFIGFLSVRATQAKELSLHEWLTFPESRYVSNVVQGPVRRDAESLGVEVAARSALVMDMASSEILFEKNADVRLPIASLTKLMTAMVFSDQRPDFKKELVMTAEDEKEDPSPFVAEERMRTRDWFEAMLVGSVNAAGNVLARSMGDREAFIKQMNLKARQLHLWQTRFFDPTGLDVRNQATSRDIAALMQAALAYPEIRETTEKPSVLLLGRINGKPYLLKSTNFLLSSFLNQSPYHIVAAKTGSLPEAGYCLVQATNDKEKHQIIVVVLGSENHFSRFQDVKALTAWAFTNFEWPKSLK